MREHALVGCPGATAELLARHARSKRMLPMKFSERSQCEVPHAPVALGMDEPIAIDGDDPLRRLKRAEQIAQPVRSERYAARKDRDTCPRWPGVPDVLFEHGVVG